MKPDCRAESGYTLTELLVCVTIMGLISFVVAQSLILTLKLGPETTERNKYSSQVSLLVNALSDDVANATAAPSYPTTSTPNCQLGTDGPNAGVSELGTFTLPSGTVRYHASIGRVTNSTAVYSVTVYRQGVKVLDAFCPATTSGVFVVSSPSLDPTYRLTMNLRASRTGPTRTVTFEGDRRTLPEPNIPNS